MSRVEYSRYLIEIQKLDEELQKLDNQMHQLLEEWIYAPIGSPYKRKLENMHEELDRMEKDLEEARSQAIYRALMYIGYNEQVDLFKRHHDKNYTGAFLLHGSVLSKHPYKEEGYSVRSLLKRMILAIPRKRTSPAIDVEFYGAGGRRGNVLDEAEVTAEFEEGRGYRHEMLEALAAPLKIDYDRFEWEKGIDTIKEKIWKRLESTDVVLVFRRVDHVDVWSLNWFVQKVWQPLVIEAHHHQFKGWHPTYLLMFLVDYTGCVKNWDIDCIEHEHYSLQPWDAGTLFRPQVLDRVSRKDLEQWVPSHYNDLDDVLPFGLTRTPTMDEKIESILRSSNNGEPDQVLRLICKHCQIDMGGMKDCLKL